MRSLPFTKNQTSLYDSMGSLKDSLRQKLVFPSLTMAFWNLHQNSILLLNSLNSNDQDALDSAAGGNFLDKDASEVSTDAPLSNSSPSNNSFDMQQIAASLEDKMTIKMNKMLNEMKALVVTTPAPVKAVEEVCVTCGSNHHFNLCPLTRGGNDFPVFHDNIQQFQQTAAVVFSTDDLGLDWISAHNFLTHLQKLSSYASGHLEVSELDACLEKASFSFTPGHVKVS
ncbi:hypothetical protein Tco_1419802 [Tanacetum coccineum]